LDDGRFGKLDGRAAIMGRRRQERHTEPGRLVETASSGQEGCSGHEKGEERFRSNFHYCLELKKISRFREPVPEPGPKRLQRFT
jgi:hypothetical protein